MAKTPSTRVTAGDVQDLAVAVEQLSEEVRLLRQAVDEIRDDLVWAARQVLDKGYEASGRQPPPPRDAFADSGRSIKSEAATEDTTDGDGSIEVVPYCCDRPRLVWNGDPDAPGIACENCGYLVAENGSVVIWRGDDDEPGPEYRPTTPEERQGSLF